MDGDDDALHVGCLLVATPLLVDQNFRKAVVLVVEHEPTEGSLGVVVNRPTEVSVEKVLPTWAGLATGPQVVFQGGPVALDNALCLASVHGEGEPLGWRRLEGAAPIDRLGLVDLDAPPEVLAAEIGSLRVFAGYAGWGKGQLEGEIHQGAWYVVPAEPDDPFAPNPRDLWRSVLRRQGGDLALMATFPEDPSLN
ncbi:MAG: YqgE/AlgH family protein [Streptosporangiaceae bacterium]